jgi:hypothetical protein
MIRTRLNQIRDRMTVLAPKGLGAIQTNGLPSRFTCRRMKASLLRAGIDGIVQAIPKEVETHNHGDDG